MGKTFKNAFWQLLYNTITTYLRCVICTTIEIIRRKVEWSTNKKQSKNIVWVEKIWTNKFIGCDGLLGFTRLLNSHIHRMKFCSVKCKFKFSFLFRKFSSWNTKIQSRLEKISNSRGVLWLKKLNRCYTFQKLWCFLYGYNART